MRGDIIKFVEISFPLMENLEEFPEQSIEVLWKNNYIAILMYWNLLIISVVIINKLRKIIYGPKLW